MAFTGLETSPRAPLPGASLGVAMWRFAANAFRLRGRASRGEYWWWMLVNVAVLATSQIMVPAAVGGAPPQPTLFLGPFGSSLFADLELMSWHSADSPGSPLGAFSLLVADLWLLLTLIPGLTVAVRRLHDSNLTGWWALLAFFPPGQLVLLLIALRRPRLEGARFDA